MKSVLLLLLLVHKSLCHVQCENPLVELHSTSTHQKESPHQRSKRGIQNLRISTYYDPSFLAMPNYATVVTSILKPAIQYWQNTLMIQTPLTSPLLIDRSCDGTYSYSTSGGNRLKVCTSSCASSQLCYTTAIPNQYIQQCYISNGSGSGYTASGTGGTGAPNTDLLLIITQKTDGCTGSVLAYAVACELEYTLDRPVLGLVNICPGNANMGVGLRMSIATIKHEIAHVLGLSSNLFAFYRNQTGSTLTPRDSSNIPNLGQIKFGAAGIYIASINTIAVYQKTFNYPTGSRTKSVSYIVTPTVKREMRNYFNCSTLEGAMLEDYGSSGSALSHLKKLYFQNELMTASINVNSQISRITLAVLQDSGWYTVNLNNSEGFTYAQGLGCNFITSSCYDYMKAKLAAGQLVSPYCNVPVTQGGLSCSPDSSSQVYCNLMDNSALAATVPAQNKYFSNPNWASPDGYSDYCPTMVVYAFYVSSVLVQTGQCNDTQNQAVSGTQNDYFNQGFGANSMCISFPPSSPWVVQSCNNQMVPSVQGAACYQYQCSSMFGLVILVNGFQYQCQYQNQIIDVTSKNTYLIPNGKLLCPSCVSVCGAVICGGASSTLAVQCNNVNRPCPGSPASNIPCSGMNLKMGFVVQIMTATIFFITWRV